MRETKTYNKNLNLATLNLMHKYLLKSLSGLLVSVIGPIAYLFLFLAISISKDTPTLYINSIYSVMSISILPISLLTIPAMNIEFKKSIFLRKLKLEKVNKYRYNALMFIYFFLVELAICLVNFCIYILVGAITKNMNIYNIDMNIWDSLKYISYGGFFYSMLMLIVISISASMLIATFIKSPLLAQVIGIGIIFLSLLFGGLIITINEWDNAVFMRYLSLISPISYPILGMNISVAMSSIETNHFLFNNLFNFSDSVKSFSISTESFEIIINSWFKPIYTILPILFSAGFVSISLWRFNFLSR